jgi:hypothetical protein
MNLMISSATSLIASSNTAMRFTTVPKGLRSYVILDHGKLSPLTQGFQTTALKEAQKHCEELEQQYAAK